MASKRLAELRCKLGLDDDERQELMELRQKRRRLDQQKRQEDEQKELEEEQELQKRDEDEKKKRRLVDKYIHEQCKPGEDGYWDVKRKVSF